ncbi:hypothetical protein C8F01DRAFT_1352251 [Mycena amicta]|nr:hypothetical protein C8F01DRAFT_1352251 [Mycena amicta]
MAHQQPIFSILVTVLMIGCFNMCPPSCIMEEPSRSLEINHSGVAWSLPPEQGLRLFPIENSLLTTLLKPILFCLSPEAAVAARTIADKMKNESGVKAAVASFHANLPLDRLHGLVEASANMVLKPYEELRRSNISPSTPAFSPVHGKPLPQLPSSLEMDDRGEGSSRGTTASQQRTGLQTAGAMAVASGALRWTFLSQSLRVFAVFRRCMDKRPTDHGAVTDWKSGAAVAGKTFVIDSAVGIADLFVQPYKGARDEGLLGLAKGVGKGCANAVLKPSAAALGLLAYPGQGIVKSIRATAHEKTRRHIIKSRHREGEWLFALDQGAHSKIVATTYEELTASRRRHRVPF